MNARRLPPAPAEAGQILDAALHLLDRQVLDRDSVPVTTVDDLEITDVPVDRPLDSDAPAPVITAILTGPVLATRIFGGRPPASRMARIPWRLVHWIDTTVHLGVFQDELEATWTERWVRDRIIRRIPGGSHDPG
ncbi:hypothetical protein [Agromyces sp. NPDC058110]|uniref:hypothetical protein n=1 Tax=Agromyces sp. NPDC058110 TaxID=3346345 RepID=UPI0036DD025E